MEHKKTQLKAIVSERSKPFSHFDSSMTNLLKQDSWDYSNWDASGWPKDSTGKVRVPERRQLAGKVISSTADKPIPSKGSHERSPLSHLLMMNQKTPSNKLSVWVSISANWSFLPT